jgi:oligoribonuclease NrnB/cAMP/cGMP phosphodiesterase (DHH superfamily)
MKIVYHSADLDGKCSAAIVHLVYQDQEPELIPMNYGELFPLAAVEAGEVVYMVDFSLPLADMLCLNQRAKLHWIDHHTQKLDEMAAAGFRASGGQLLAHDDPAACELAWQYLHPDQAPPAAVHLLGRYDAWDRSFPEFWQEAILPFQHGMRLSGCDPGDIAFWQRVLAMGQDDVDRIVDQGEVAIRAARARNEHCCLASAFRTSFDGYATLACNRLFADSSLFDACAARAEAELLVSFGYDANPAFRVSLTPGPANPGLDVAELAKRHGGGGHKGRAGFCCRRLPFALPPVPGHLLQEPEEAAL